MSDSTAVVVRRMTVADVKEVVELHRVCFPDYFVTRLGPAFLCEFYREALGEIALVAVMNGRLLGTQLTFTRPSKTFLRMLRSGGLRFALAAAPTALRGPRHALRVALALAKPWQARRPAGQATAMYTAVSPAARGQGVAKLLLKRMIAEADLVGVSSIHGENNDEPALNYLYESVGFRKAGVMRTLDGRTKVVMRMEVPEAVALHEGDADFEAARRAALALPMASANLASVPCWD